MSRLDFTSHRLFTPAPLATGAMIELTREQANYLVNVLRLGEGAQLLVFNGSDGEWRAELTNLGKRAVQLRIETQIRSQEGLPDVEMGARRLRPVLTRRTQSSRINLVRMRANVVEAAEQCGLLALAEVLEQEKLEMATANWPVDRLLIFCDEAADIADPVEALREAGEGFSRFAVLIGPEGGFDDNERAYLSRIAPSIRISLGPRVLRADTAAVAALTLVQAVLGDWRA
jgi:16S rRNA (uracil1498-N3)-methyltransferase